MRPANSLAGICGCGHVSCRKGGRSPGAKPDLTVEVVEFGGEQRTESFNVAFR